MSSGDSSTTATPRIPIRNCTRSVPPMGASVGRRRLNGYSPPSCRHASAWASTPPLPATSTVTAGSNQGARPTAPDTTPPAVPARSSVQA